MAQRLELQALLLTIVPNVYFQPPPDVHMIYPCAVYARTNLRINHADNKPYKKEKEYEVTVIDRDPDSDIPDQISELPKCSFQRHFTADNLNHDVYQLFF